jgi:hypothetical protein
MDGNASETARCCDRREVRSHRGLRMWPASENGEIRIASGKDTRFLNEVISGLHIYSERSLF